MSGRLIRLQHWQCRIICLLYGCLFLTLPFSVEIPVAGFMLSVPAEPLMLPIALLTGLMALQKGVKNFWHRHPIFLAAIVYILWMGAMVPFSSMPLVSAKYFIITGLHAWVGLAPVLLLPYMQQSFGSKSSDDQLLPLTLLNLYLLSFGLVMVYASWVYVQMGLRSDASVLIARPFYFDHTAYSTVMAILFWVPWEMAFSRIGDNRFSRQIVPMIIRSLLFIGMALSYSRATWISMALAGSVWLFRSISSRQRIFFAGILIFTGLVYCLVLQSWSGGIDVMGRQTSVSDQERLNRYSCAWRMFKDRPLTGFGAGTFPDQYIPYQLEAEMTRISVTHAGLHPAGRGGSTHSEYFQALSELGLPGALCWVFFAAAAFISAFRYPIHHPRTMAALGLVTYMTHGFFNNFLHTDKIGILVWLLFGFLILKFPQKQDTTL